MILPLWLLILGILVSLTSLIWMSLRSEEERRERWQNFMRDAIRDIPNPQIPERVRIEDYWLPDLTTMTRIREINELIATTRLALIPRSEKINWQREGF